MTYGPLAETPLDPDLILIRVDGRQLMMLVDTLPDLRIEGKPSARSWRWPGSRAGSR